MTAILFLLGACPERAVLIRTGPCQPGLRLIVAYTHPILKLAN
jgi:hypothetical protein